ncbi:hypothetical protein SELMODRAFT_423591 [Selaginella moellendorffii]|uniref:Uncharacterized protein n=2 Tax=Selaginella moellendorffii TaxID=88036 RepID=D8SM68_SELML|nr:hypothetical protein SELMODRAFT_423591 [Selaginella moellendorffii]
MEMVRKIILEQEAQFRQQVQELHRVYRVQKLLLQDLRPPRAIDSSRLELASGYDGSGKKSDAKPRRRTFDLELPAEEYMDVEMEEPSSNAATTTTANNNNNSSSAACDLVSRLSAAAAATAATAAPAPAMNSVKNLDSSAAVHEKVGSQQQIGWNSGRDGESEIFQMIKRAKSSGSDGGGGGGGGGFKQQQQQVLPCVTQGILGGIWGYGFDNTGGAQALRNAAAAAVEKSRAPPNGFHLAASDKVSKPQQQQQQQQQQEVLSMNSKAAENQHVVFLEPGPNNRFAAENGKGLGGSSSSSSGIENLNPFFASAAAAAAAAMERGPSAEDNGKFFGASLGGLQNHVSYSSQGILIPSTNMARREPVPPPSSSSSSSSAFMEASPPGGLGLWWKSNSNYYHQPHQPQYQQVAVLQAGTPAQSVQVAWQGGSGFATTSPSPSSYQQQHHHAAVLGVVPPPPPPAAPPPANYASNNNKEESGGGSGCWLKGASSNASTAPSPGFLYSASTPPKPPFKKPPKLILDGATMELKLAPLDRDGPPVVGLLRQHGDETAAAALVVATDQRKRGDSTESPVNGSEVAKLEAGEHKDESKPKGLDLNPPGGLGLSSSDKPNSGLLDVVKPIKQDAQAVERDEVLQERRGGSRDEADLGRCEEAPSCSCSQPGCPICDTGSVEDVQVKQRSGKIEKVAVRSSSEQQQQQQHKAREEVRDSAEPPAAPPTSSKKRRFKLVSSKDLLATRESDNATTNGKKRPEAIAEELDSRTGELSRDGEGEKKKRKHLVNPKSLKSSSSSKSHSNHQGVKEKESSTLKASPSGSRHKEKDKDKDKAGSNGYSFLADNPDDGANLAAEILVSLAPAKRDHVQPEKNGDSGVLRLHHKSKRRLIETLPTGVANHAAPPAAAAAPPKPSPAVAEPVKDESKKKKKKKKSKNSKTIVAKFQESVVAAEDPPKASFKSVKVALTQCEGGGGGGGGGNGGAAAEAPKSSSKIKKKLVTKKQQQQQQQNDHQQHQHHTPSSRSSKSSAGAARDLSSTTNITKAVNSSSKPRDHRDGGGHAHPHHETKRISSASSNYGSNNSTSEQESLDRLSQQQQHQNSGENSSEEIMGKESDEFEEEWSRRSWGPAARRKRMRRSRPGL